ncbi:MAG: hypothetical protein PHU85_00345 [Phycisphaerae bacterium]|nr:hypothetical protein [Phycisphaerae bacterium]
MSAANDNPTALAEQKARSNGYAGVWPPPPRPRVETAQDLERVLAKLTAGELSAHNVAAAGAHLLDFFGALEPERFRQLGEHLRAIVLEGDAYWRAKNKVPPREDAIPAPRVRIRAVESILKPMLRVLQLAPEMARHRGAPAPLLAHLYRCVLAFVGVFGGGVMGQIADELMALATSGRSTDTNVRAAASATGLVVLAMETGLKGLAALGAAPEEIDAGTQERIRAAQAQFEAMSAKLDEKRARAAAPAPTEGCPDAVPAR